MIPVFEPYIGEEEEELVVAAIRRGEISGSFGDAIPAFEREFASWVGAEHGVACTSGTTALELACAAAGLKRGDEVLVSASTNIATALGAYRLNAVPVPVDSEPDTWNLDLSLLESLIGERTRAIIPVHLFGHPVDMDALNAIARRHDLLVIEDAAEAHGATVRGRMVGALGDMGCFSFYANKIITTGEGGMVTTNDASLADELRLLRNLAFIKPRFYHEQAGFNFRMTGYQAAMGSAQLARIDWVLDQKRRVARLYDEALADIPGLQLPVEREWARNVYWMYAIQLRPDFPLSRDELMPFLRERDIDTRTFFCPINQQPFLREQEGYRPVECPVADEMWCSGLYLPSSLTLTESEIGQVAAALAQAAAG